MKYDNNEYQWLDDGFWHQVDGTNLANANLCDDLNRQRKADMGYMYVPGFGVKNSDGVVIYDRGFKRKKQRLYYDKYETDHGDGHYVFDKVDENYPSFIDYWFVLDDSGYWVQIGDRYIQGIDGKEQQESALAALNDGVDKGIGIKNSGGVVLTKYL